MIQHFIATLDGKPTFPCPKVCEKGCIWWCNCGVQAASNPEDPQQAAMIYPAVCEKGCTWWCNCGVQAASNLRDRPPPPGMVEIVKRRIEAEAKAPPDCREEVLRKRQKINKVATTPLTCVTTPPTSSSQPAESLGQKTWKAVEKVLKPKTLRLERTKPMFEELLGDLRISINLPITLYYLPHCKQVVASLPQNHRFKIGITVCPNNRFYEAHYAYSKPRAQERDWVRYSGMIVLFTHYSRDTIAVMEHALITHFSQSLRQSMRYRCANRKTDVDDHIRFDESCSSDDEHSPGPHSLYVSHGKPM